MEWESIETAPKDGTEILLGWWSIWPGEGFRMEVGRYSNVDTARPGRGCCHATATHWMPLPQPPAMEG